MSDAQFLSPPFLQQLESLFWGTLCSLGETVHFYIFSSWEHLTRYEKSENPKHLATRYGSGLVM